MLAAKRRINGDDGLRYVCSTLSITPKNYFPRQIVVQEYRIRLILVAEKVIYTGKSAVSINDTFSL